MNTSLLKYGTYFLVLSFIVGVLIPPSIGKDQELEVITVYVPVKQKEDPFTEEALIEYLQQLRVPHPHIALAQAKLETGNFTSPIFKENNNLFGMKRAYTRPSTGIGINRGHAKYSHWKDSVVDFTLYKAYVVGSRTEEEYYSFIGRRYAEDPLYSRKVRTIANGLVHEFE